MLKYTDIIKFVILPSETGTQCYLTCRLSPVSTQAFSLSLSPLSLSLSLSPSYLY